MQNKERLKRVLMVAVPGIDAACFNANRALLPNLSAQLGTPIQVYCKSHHCFPGDPLIMREAVHAGERKLMGNASTW